MGPLRPQRFESQKAMGQASKMVLLSRDVSTVSFPARRLDERVRNSDDLARIKRDLSDKLAILQA